MSKYIGETEKALARVFDRAAREGCMLVFDEADAVFGRRTEVSDSHDRYANQEVSYLLSRIEAHPGVVVLTTNLLANIDEAFQRRIHVMVEFPEPGPGERARLWRSVLPRELPVARTVDLDALAQRYALSGAQIRDASLDAAYLAAADGRVVTQEYLVSGIHRQFEKAGTDGPVSAPAVAAAPETEHGAASRATSPGPAPPAPEPLLSGAASGRGPERRRARCAGGRPHRASRRVGGRRRSRAAHRAAPFVDLSGRAGFRADGTLDGTVAMRGVVTLLGLPVAETTWSVAGWDGGALAAPAVSLRGTTLALDLSPVGAEVALTATEGLTASRTDTGATIALPDGALPPGLPLEPRVVELFRGLRGWDVTGLRAHPDSPVESAPAFVSDTDLFFAPGRYGPDSPETAALLDAAIRAALAGIVGAVDPDPAGPSAAAGPRRGRGSRRLDGTGRGDGARDARGGAARPRRPPPRSRPRQRARPRRERRTRRAARRARPRENPHRPSRSSSSCRPPRPSPGPPRRPEPVASPAARAAPRRAARTLPTAEENVADARGAVTEPAAETAARAREDLAAALGERPAPSPEIVELCERIRTAIREQRPVDEDDLLDRRPHRRGADRGRDDLRVRRGAGRRGPGQLRGPGQPPGRVARADPHAGRQPGPVEPRHGRRRRERRTRPDPAGEPLARRRRRGDGPAHRRLRHRHPRDPGDPGRPVRRRVRDSRGELGELAAQTPQELAAEQDAAIDERAGGHGRAPAPGDPGAAWPPGRARSASVAGGQGEAVQGEEQTRDSVAQRATAIFTTAQQQVTTLLEPLSRTAMARWDAGLTRLSQEFHDSLDRVAAWIDERHSGVDGFVVGIGDCGLRPARAG